MIVPTCWSMLACWSVQLVDPTGMHKTGCFGETRLVLHIPSSSSAGKRYMIIIHYYFYMSSILLLCWSAGGASEDGAKDARWWASAVLFSCFFVKTKSPFNTNQKSVSLSVILIFVPSYAWPCDWKYWHLLWHNINVSIFQDVFLRSLSAPHQPIHHLDLPKAQLQQGIAVSVTI